MNIRKSLFMGIVALGLSPLALANGNGYMPAAQQSSDNWEPGLYLGLQLGYGMTNWDNLDYTYENTHYSVDKTDAFAGRFNIGYDFHKNFAIEAGYAQFFNSPKWAGDSSNFLGNTYAIDLLAKIKAEVVDNFGLYAKAGIAYMHTNDGEGIYSSNAVDNFNVAYGAGAYYDINKNLAVDISWLRYNGDPQGNSKDYQPYADLFAVGIQYKFIM